MDLGIFAKKKLVAGLWMVAAGSAMAADIQPGCYERIYGDDYLRDHPAQVVWQIRLKLGARRSDGTHAGRLKVIAANQGHARQNDMMGRVLEQDLSCGAGAGDAVCRAACDAGALDITKLDGSGLTFRTRYLMVGEDRCDLGMDLAEIPNAWVSYRLNRVAETVCSGM